MNVPRLRSARRRLARGPRAVWLALLVCVLITAPASASQPDATPDARGMITSRQAGGPAAFLPGEVLIGWQPGEGPVPTPADALRGPTGRPPRSAPLTRADAGWQAAAAVLNTQTGRQVIDAQPAFGYARLAVPAGQERAEMARLAAMPWVRYAEPNYLIHAAGTSIYPNDPYYWQQWNMTKVSAPQAWNVTMGLSLVTVAVLDSGVDFGHPDLTGRLLEGTNFVTAGTKPQDDAGHGTHVAGIIAANTNNGIGVAGMAGKVMILPYKILGPDGQGRLTGNVADMVAAIRAAVNKNAQVINISAGGLDDSTFVHDAVRDARAAGVLVVAAAGNYGSANPVNPSDTNPVFYPAAYPEALAVAATDVADGHPDYSGHKSYVGLAAPGGTPANPIVSTYLSSVYPYASMYGTSMAAPMVSGAAALILSLYPAMSADDLVFTLEHSADKVGPYAYPGGRNDYFGYGRLNVWKALQPLRASTQRLTLTADCTTRLSDEVTIQNIADQPVNWVVDLASGQGWLTVTPSSGSLAARSITTLTMQSITNTLGSGSYDGLVRVRPSNAAYTTVDISVHLSYISGVPYCLQVPMVTR